MDGAQGSVHYPTPVRLIPRTYLFASQGLRQHKCYFYTAQLSEAGQKWYNFALTWYRERALFPRGSSNPGFSRQLEMLA
jgi:hypothetical protein